MEFLEFLEPWMIPIVVMICVTLICFFSSVTKIITTSMKRKEGSSNLSENKEFLNALREFKENMERRISNLEKIVAAENSSTKKRIENQGKEKQRAIELELDNDSASEEETSEPSKLKNMLNQ